jgi:hypothetical protein
MLSLLPLTRHRWRLCSRCSTAAARGHGTTWSQHTQSCLPGPQPCLPTTHTQTNQDRQPLTRPHPNHIHVHGEEVHWAKTKAVRQHAACSGIMVPPWIPDDKRACCAEPAGGLCYAAATTTVAGVVVGGGVGVAAANAALTAASLHMLLRHSHFPATNRNIEDVA